MKNILFILGLIGLIFTACDPTESIYNDLDEAKEPYKEAIMVDFVDDDYTDMANWYKTAHQTTEDSALADELKDKKAFSMSIPSEKFVPLYLGNTYLALDKNSSANVTLNFDEGETETQVLYKSAVEYRLSDNDYESVGGKVAEYGFFMPSFPADDYISDILVNAIDDAVEDELRLVRYQYVNEDPTLPSTVDVFKDDFQVYDYKDPIDQNGWLDVATVGDRIWEGRTFSDNAYPQASAFRASGDIEMVLVSPAVDLSGSDDNKLSFDVNVGFYNHTTTTPLKIYIISDFDGDATNRTSWVDVTDNFTIPTEPSSTYGVMGPAGVMDLDAYNGSINVAFVYTGNATETSTIQVDNFRVYAGAKLDSERAYQYYKFDGSAWELDNETVRILQAFEYDEMGSPGKYNNFSSSDKPEDYIPNFLLKNYPYALMDDVKSIAYHYFSGGTSVRVDNYKRNAISWEKVESVIEKTEQYVHNGSAWFFDPTVSFTIGKDDYQIIVDAVKDTHPELIDRGNSEYYYGASAWYSNFDMRNTKRTTGDFAQTEYDGLSSDEIQAKIAERVQEGILVMLKAKFPDAVTQVNGIDVNYVVTYKVYDNDLKKFFYTVTYKCTKAGPSADFELVEGPVKEE